MVIPKPVTANSRFLQGLFMGEKRVISNIASTAPTAGAARSKPNPSGPTFKISLAKMGMSFVTLGLAEEFKGRVAVNALWPKTVIATDAINMIPGVDINAARNAEIVADAAIAILLQKFSAATGLFYIDEDLLRDNGVTDFEQYAMAPGTPLLPDFFL
mgnify:CR=1 FL=1